MRIWCIVDPWSRYPVCAYVDQTNEGRANLAVASFSSEDPCCQKMDDPSVPVEVDQITYDLICTSVPPSVIDPSLGRIPRQRIRLGPEVESLSIQLPCSITVDRGYLLTSPVPQFR